MPEVLYQRATKQLASHRLGWPAGMCRIVVSIAVFVLACDVRMNAAPLQGDSYVEDVAGDRTLMSELSRQIAKTKTQYNSYTVEVRKRTLRIDRNAHETEELNTQMRLYRRGAHLFRADGTSTNVVGQIQSGIFLMNGREGWHLRLDPATSKHFITEHGEAQVTESCQSYSWYAEAAYSFHLQPVDQVLFANETESSLLSVTDGQNNRGERLIVVTQEITPLYPDLIPAGLAPCTRTLRFLRDYNCVLQDGVVTGWSSSGHQTLTKQRCEYEPFTKTVPRLAGVTIERFSREQGYLGGESPWEPYLREVVIVKDLSFDPPDESLFEIANLVDVGRRRSPRADSMKWVFGLSGLGFLFLWFLLRGVSRKRGEPTDSRR